MVRWLTAFIDRTASSFGAAARFWCAVTHSSLSPPRGVTREFATLLPPDGDPYLRVQRVAEGSGGTHLDLHVDDIASFARRAEASGAVRQVDHDDVVVLRSPAGLPWCVVGHDGESVRPTPRPAGTDGHRHLVDQVCIDIPRARYDEECAFWSDLTGWEIRDSSLRSEFRYLVRPEGMPLRLLLQRREDEGPARAHLDLSSDDVGAVVAHHEMLGAVIVDEFPLWTVMEDPAGLPYCITARDPDTGMIATGP
jgi:hypothetical protein